MNVQSKYDRLGVDFELEMLERGHALFPSNLEIVAALAAAFTESGAYEQGLAMDQLLADRLPEDAVVHYNLACSLSLTGRLDEALASLRKAVELGYREFAFMQEDRDLVSVRADPRFHSLIHEFTQR